MQYTVLFFAASTEKLVREITDATDAVLEKTRQFLEEKSEDPEAVASIIAAAEEICRQKAPRDAPQPYFDAMYAILNVLAERIELGSFQFGTCLYLMDIGIWPWTQQEPPPFPLPRRQDDTPPTFGYMPCEFMRTTVLPGMAELPPCEMSGQRARNEFAEIVESVVADGLDLFAYYSVW